MLKKKGVRETIEEVSTQKPNAEHIFIKFPGKELRNITLVATSNFSIPDMGKIRRIAQELEVDEDQSYTHLHTHPYHDTHMFGLIPSPGDMRSFIGDSRAKTMAIALQDEAKGEISGYLIMRKTKGTPKISILDAKKDVLKGYSPNNPDDMEKYLEDLGRVHEEYHLRTRFVPAQGYKLNESEDRFIKKEGLETRLGFLAIGSLLASFIFTSSNLTGNAIGSNQITNWLGAALFIIGLALAFWRLKIKK